MFKTRKKKDKRQKLSTLGIVLSLSLIPGLSVLYIIGLNSTMLVIRPLRYIIIFLLSISLIILLISITIYIENKPRRAKKIKKSIKIFLIILYCIYFIGCNVFLVMLYGKNDKFRSWLITTAMQTMNHQYLCKWFYNDNIINELLNSNAVIESGEDTDISLVQTGSTKWRKETYKDEYEKAILDVDDNIKYKIIELEVNGCNGYLAVVYDPSMVKLAVTKYLHRKGQYVTEMAADRNALLAINGGGFFDPGNTGGGGTPTGVTISDGKVLTNGQYGHNVQGGGVIGFNNDNVLVLSKDLNAYHAINNGIRDAISWGPFLIVNGTPSFIKGNGGWGYAARSAIGQRADGIVLLLEIDSNATRTKGADMVDLTEIMQNYGAVNAANLDGGTSSVMVMPKTIAQTKYKASCADYFSEKYCDINDPIDGGLDHRSRPIADAWVVVDN